LKTTDRHIRVRFPHLLAAAGAAPSGGAMQRDVSTEGRLVPWPSSSCSMKPQPHILTIRWDAISEDGAEVTFQADLCKFHRQVVALKSSGAQGVRRQFGESCDLCQGREPRILKGEPPKGQ
jgi:hypothetical protein